MTKLFPNRFYQALILLVACCGIMSSLSFNITSNKTGTLKITFINTANGKMISLDDSLYNNAFGEQYTISKLKYYISNIYIPGAKQPPETDPYHLINAREENNSFELLLKPGTYKKLSFFLGVDSARNCSGAQTGALDPMNDMFWTWNTGYVMFKLEGTSTASTSDLQRIEHHIGGFKGDYNVVTKIDLDFPALQIGEGQLSEIIIETNLDHYWKATTEIKIRETPICMSPGKLAKKMATNFSSLFSVKYIK